MLLTSGQLRPAGRKTVQHFEEATRRFKDNKPTKYIALFSFLLISMQIPIGFIESSPPLDYFLYTGQPGEGGRAQLEPLERIYSPEAGASLELANRTLAIVRNSSHSHDNDQIDINVARYAWHLMERQSLAYYERQLAAMTPIVDELLREAQIGSQCASSIRGWLGELRKLELWASLMWNSWGQFPPAGLYEGSFTDLGSYRGCMSVPENELIGGPQYCTFDYQPLVPTRPRFHSIYKKILDLEPQTGQLVYGDFRSLEAADSTAAGGSAKRSSETSAHTFSSQNFKTSLGQTAGNNQQQAKYNKRTIVYNGTSSHSAQLPGNAHLLETNLTIRAKALVELAKKAQYFYYVKFRLGACLPSKCSQEEVERIAKSSGQRAILQTSQVKCMKKETSELNGYQKTAIWILSVLAFIALIGTLVDLFGPKERTNSSSSLAYWLLPFSVWTNGRRLFDSDTPGAHTDLECIHGLRFFSMLWVVYGHTILYTEYQAFTHFYNVIETQIPSLLLLPTLNANFSVDTFFVISGILTTYVTWEYTKGDSRKFNKFAFLISRYIRLTPQLAIVILCFFLLPLFGEGPLYKQITEKQAELCHKNWFINLLYIQTYINSEKLCIDPSWWLSIEMTFHLISMVVIVGLIKDVARGMLLNLVLGAGLTLYGAFVHYSHGMAIQYLPSIPQRYEVAREQTQIFFHRPYPHAASYFIGIALGYVLAERTIKKLSRPLILQGWLVCAGGLVVSLWGSYFWNLGAPYTQLQATLYYTLCQLLWPVSIAWIILACSLGHGGVVNSVLSAKCFVPLGRITYMTYLSHALIIYYHSASINIPIEPSRMLFLYLFLANTFLALLLGLLLTLLYESPLLNLQKILFTYLTNKFDPTLRERTDANALEPTRASSSKAPNATTTPLLAPTNSDQKGSAAQTNWPPAKASP